MDANAIGSLSTALTQSKTDDAISVAVLKKAMDMQAQSAAQLIEALPQPPSNPAHLGQGVDVKA